MIVGTTVPTIIVGTIVTTMIAGTKILLAAVPTITVGTTVPTSTVGITIGITVPTAIAGSFFLQLLQQLLLEKLFQFACWNTYTLIFYKNQ